MYPGTEKGWFPLVLDSVLVQIPSRALQASPTSYLARVAYPTLHSCTLFEAQVPGSHTLCCEVIDALPVPTGII